MIELKELTYEQALDLSIDLWKWLKNTPYTPKNKYPYYESIRKFIWECPLCDLYFNENNCGKCPLHLHDNISMYPCCEEYYNWNKGNNTKKNATIIYKKLLQARRKNKFINILKKLYIIKKRMNNMDIIRTLISMTLSCIITCMILDVANILTFSDPYTKLLIAIAVLSFVLGTLRPNLI